MTNAVSTWRHDQLFPPDVGYCTVVERVAELGVDAAARLDLPRVVLAPERTRSAGGNRRKELARQGERT